MYTLDYGNVQFMYEDRLREAERQRKQHALILAAQAYADRENRGGLLRQIKHLLQINAAQQETRDVRRATAH